MRKSNTQSLKEVIMDYLKALGLDKRLKEQSIINEWHDLLGKTISKATKEIYIQDGILYVQLYSSVIKHELLMLKQEIQRKLNEKVGEPIIRDIVFR